MSDNSGLRSTEQLFEILSNITDDYICLIDVNLTTHIEQQYMFHGNEYVPLPEWSRQDDYETCIHDYATTIVAPEDRGRFEELTQLDRLLSVLAQQKVFIIQYDAIVGGERRHFQGRFTLGSSSGIPHMYVGIRDISVTRTNELRSLEMSDSQQRRQLSNAGMLDKRVILIIEDNEIEREILTAILSEHFHILCASNGEEGLYQLQMNYRIISLILLDLNMPVMDGKSFQRIAKSDRLFCNIPIIITTGSENYQEETECLRNGAADYMHKPYDSERLLIRLNNIIRLHESDATLAAIEFDGQTGLYTKQAFYHHAENIIRQHPNDNFTLIVSDVLGFRSINSRYGIRMGDRVISAFIPHIKRISYTYDAIAGRLDTDRFLLLIHTASDSINLEAVSEALQSTMRDMPLPGVETKLGIYDHVDHDVSIQTVADRALLALDDIKHRYGIMYAFYNDSIQKKADKLHAIEEDMKSAVKDGQFCVYYQPKHDSCTGRLVGAEALLRWKHPEYGFMSPSEFIPIFEMTGFSLNADCYVWSHSCRNIRRWLDSGLKPVPVSVNFSRMDFNSPDLCSRVCAAVSTHSIPARYMHVEVTESVFTENERQIIALLNEMRSNGHMVELDDFGSGYSTLNALAELPIDIVKFDMKFVQQLENPRKMLVFAECVKLANAMGFLTVAEGVEDKAQLESARDCGINVIQGYYFSKPLCEDEFEEYLKHNT